MGVHADYVYRRQWPLIGFGSEKSKATDLSRLGPLEKRTARVGLKSTGGTQIHDTSLVRYIRLGCGLCIALIRPNHWAASVAQWLEHLSSKQCVVGSNPTRAALFSFRRKKELFGLVAFPFFLFIEKSFHVRRKKSCLS